MGHFARVYVEIALMEGRGFAGGRDWRRTFFSPFWSKRDRDLTYFRGFGAEKRGLTEGNEGNEGIRKEKRPKWRIPRVPWWLG